MGKENKAPKIPGAAPKTSTPKESNTKSVDITRPVIGNTPYKGLSPDETVIALERIGKMIYDNPNAKNQFNLTDDQISAYNEFVLAGMTATLVVDVVEKKSKWSLTMSKAQFEVVKRVAKEIGVTFDEKYLPASDEAGTVNVQLNNESIKIEEKTKEAIEKEIEIAKSEVNLDPTKFQNDEDLAAALNYIVVSEKSAFLKFTRTVALLKSYRLIQASKDEEAKKAIESKTHGELLSEVFNIISNSKNSNMPIIFNGFGKYIYRETSQAMSPVLAFCKLRDASKNSAGVPSVTDDMLVGILRTLIEYNVNAGIAAEEAKIEEHKKNLKALGKDKKNQKAVEDITSKIDICNANIEHFKDVIQCVYCPTSEFADNFLTDYEDKDSKTYRRAHQAFKYITQSMYGDDATKAANQDHVEKNVQQYIGIFTNLFRPAADQFDQYSSSKLIEIGEPEKN